MILLVENRICLGFRGGFPPQNVLFVDPDCLVNIAVKIHLALIEDDASLAELLCHGAGMGDKQQGCVVFGNA